MDKSFKLKTNRTRSLQSLQLIIHGNNLNIRHGPDRGVLADFHTFEVYAPTIGPSVIILSLNTNRL